MDDDDFNPFLGCVGVLILLLFVWPMFGALWRLFSGG